MSGPLGNIPGMFFDTSRNKYFPIPRATLPVPRSNLREMGIEPLMPTTECVESVQSGKKRLKIGHASSSFLVQAGPSRRRVRVVHRGRDWERDSVHRTHFASLREEGKHKLSHCLGERVTSYKSMAKGSYYATTDHGRVILNRGEGTVHVVTVCAHALVALHADIARMTFLAIAAGPEPHVHHFRRDPASGDHFSMDHTDLDLPHGNLYSSSSYDDTCAIAAEKSIIVVKYDQAPRVEQKRHLTSDPLCLHQAEPNILYAGLRSSAILMQDLRVHPQSSRPTMTMPSGKAMVGVKRLRDSAVPWGLVASAMDHQLCIFDVRYGKSPLRELQGHVNNYQQYLGLATSPDGRFVFAGGSDHRVRCWDTITGQVIEPAPQRYGNPLQKSFEHRVQILDVRDDLGLDVVDKGELQRFGRYT
ncbi:hypothetical protein BCR39DRAFT_540981 [Naematelia encephala]|uniref:Uncharacterized protein n=1 Tax=Naematelia encephala TaxID=71784 RepID=A0A1Y2AV78_9TREE|nr:hypothetical protein BCR39DRAFT_540981 [Naematelia encephala]